MLDKIKEYEDNQMDIEAISNYPLLQVFKAIYMQSIEGLDDKSISEKITASNNTEYVELYHGTSARYLHSIIKDGLQPNRSGDNQWEGNDFPPMKNVVYLTDRWHIVFANQSYVRYQSSRHPLFQLIANGQIDGTKPFTGQKKDFPIYLKVRVAKSRLIADEDFFLSRKMNERLEGILQKHGLTCSEIIASNTIPSEIKKEFMDIPIHEFAQSCLDYTGTVAVIGHIPPEDIVEITSLASLKTINYSIINEEHPYYQDYITWQKGNGKGKMKPKEIRRLETGLAIDATIKMKPSIKEIIADYDRKKLIIKE